MKHLALDPINPDRSLLKSNMPDTEAEDYHFPRHQHPCTMKDSDWVQMMKESGKIAVRPDLFIRDVREIRRRLQEGEKIDTLMRDYGMSKPMLTKIRKGLIYNEL